MVADFAEKGYMSAGLKLVLERVFKEFTLHRLEANIQPENTHSVELKRNDFVMRGILRDILRLMVSGEAMNIGQLRLKII